MSELDDFIAGKIRSSLQQPLQRVNGLAKGISKERSREKENFLIVDGAPLIASDYPAQNGSLLFDISDSKFYKYNQILDTYQITGCCDSVFRTDVTVERGLRTDDQMRIRVPSDAQIGDTLVAWVASDATIYAYNDTANGLVGRASTYGRYAPGYSFLSMRSYVKTVTASDIGATLVTTLTLPTNPGANDIYGSWVTVAAAIDTSKPYGIPNYSNPQSGSYQGFYTSVYGYYFEQYTGTHNMLAPVGLDPFSLNFGVLCNPGDLALYAVATLGDVGITSSTDGETLFESRAPDISIWIGSEITNSLDAKIQYYGQTAPAYNCTIAMRFPRRVI